MSKRETRDRERRSEKEKERLGENETARERDTPTPTPTHTHIQESKYIEIWICRTNRARKKGEEREKVEFLSISQGKVKSVLRKARCLR